MLRPFGHKVLLRQDAIEEKVTLAEGIEFEIISDERTKKLERASLQTGTIVAIGPDAWKAWRQIDENGIERNGLPWAKVGEKVSYAKFGGAFITDPYTEEEFVLLNDEDLHCGIEEGPNG